ncbi:hypothetical protein NHX12_023345 [Muraenolepis orangiensis]|uniref:Uncharacterized protein n=1 Tax=Muraenolepis orangiensis TaxID=630683 RepID=A0A9Q0ISN9_9TELE|nr:hypothetical protein NHX12_023345 [Muraenolepis orangiensis]
MGIEPGALPTSQRHRGSNPVHYPPPNAIGDRTRCTTHLPTPSGIEPGALPTSQSPRGSNPVHYPPPNANGRTCRRISLNGQ